MSNVFSSILFFIIATFSCAPVMARDTTPCDNLVAFSSLSKHELTAENALSLLKNIIKPYIPFESQEYKDAIFTTTSGFALLATCHSTIRFERSLYYPVGLTGIKLGEKNITKDGVLTNYSYVLTNYGLRVYIPSTNLQKIDANYVYVFANSRIPTQYCAGLPTCKEKKGREIHPNLRFAMVTKKIEVEKLTHDLANNQCGSYFITPINSGNTPTYENYAKLSTCKVSTEGSTVLSDSLKITWEDKVLENIDKSVNGTFARLSPKIAKDVLSILALSNTKECSTVKVEQEVGTIGLAAKTPEFLASLSGDIVKSVEFKRTAPSNYYFRFATFSWNISQQSDYDIEDISFISKCQDLKPHTPLYITLYSKMFAEDSITINVDQLTQSYVDYLGTSGLVKTTDIDDFRQGRFWYIVGSDQYFQWRGIVKFKLKNSKQVKDLLFSYPNEDKEQILAFLTHVFLASSFKYHKEEKPIF